VVKTLANEYRPWLFSEVVGQPLAIKLLKGVASSRSSSSLVLKGPKGCSKTTLARIFGRAIACETFKKTQEVCSRDKLCPHCQEASLKNSLSYMEFDSSRTGSVEAIKGLDSIFSMIPQTPRSLVFDESHAASKQALTSLLKTIEEGIKNTFFVFCSTESILDTIESRSLVIDIIPVQQDLVKERVKQVAIQAKIEVTDEQLNLIAVKAHGHLRDALSILECFALAGDDALKSPIIYLKRFIVAILKHQDSDSLLQSIMCFPTVDIRNAINVMLKDIFTTEGQFEKQLRQMGMGLKLFNFFYAPISQAALREEAGTYLLLKSLAERFKVKTA
jgi:DNA polymerase III subunit gamma/tau